MYLDVMQKITFVVQNIHDEIVQVDSGEEDEVGEHLGMMNESNAEQEVGRHARKCTMLMVSTLSTRQGSPTKRTRHGLQKFRIVALSTFISCIRYCFQVPARLIIDNRWSLALICGLDAFGLLMVHGRDVPGSSLSQRRDDPPTPDPS